MTSSYSNISHGDAHTSGQFPSSSDPHDGGGNGGDEILANVDPTPLIDDRSSLYKTLHAQALALVERDTLVIPFTTPSGHVHILRSLAPETVYIQESLCGEDGDIVANLSGWVKQTVVVIGDEGGHGGLVDTDDEVGDGGDDAAAAKRAGEIWWQKEERTGLGKRVQIVESLKVGDDWRRRVTGLD